ncbi:hypothetical protein LAZ67_16001444, partial [Cordylochernes scorpioides]
MAVNVNKLEKFSGDKGSIRPESWLKLYELETGKLDEVDRINNLIYYLSKFASEWFADEILSNASIKKWDTVKLKLIQRFGYKVESPIVAASKEDLKKKKTVEDYFRDKIRLLNQTSLNNVEKLKMLTDGLPLDWKNYLGLTRESQSPWAFPVVLVSKKDGSQRMCIDYRKLNAITIDDKKPLPYIQDMFDRLHNAKYFTTLDIAWAIGMLKYIQTLLRKLLSLQYFSANNSAYYWKSSLEPVFVIIKDDILIYSSTFKDHINLMKKIFDKLKENNIKLKLKKCSFANQEIRYLGNLFLNLVKLRSFNKPHKKNKLFKWTTEFFLHDPSLPCKLYTDASKLGIGAILAQIGNDNQEHVISYYSGKLLPHQQNYSAFELECFAVVQSVEYFEVYLENNTFEGEDGAMERKPSWESHNDHSPIKNPESPKLGRRHTLASLADGGGELVKANGATDPILDKIKQEILAEVRIELNKLRMDIIE